MTLAKLFLLQFRRPRLRGNILSRRQIVPSSITWDAISELSQLTMHEKDYSRERKRHSVAAAALAVLLL